MTKGALEIKWAGERLVLLPERALWWAREKTIFIADPHFGKASAFRSAGIAVPETAHDDDLNRLTEVLSASRANRLIILGDFFHAKSGRSSATLSALAAWREQHAHLEIVLVLGNHDRHAGYPPEEWSITCITEPWRIATLSCFHHPPEKSTAHSFAGHVHPAFAISAGHGPTMRAPCFYFRERVAVLPAFGSFTGMHTVQTQPGDRVYMIAPNEIIDASKFAGRSRK